MIQVPSPHQLSRRFVRAACWIGGFVVLLGLLVLIGWSFEIDLLKRIFHGLASMNPVTAFCLILSGASLLLQSRNEIGPQRFLGKFLAIASLILSVPILAGHIFQFETGLDQIFFADKLLTDLPDRPNQVAPNSAFCLSFLGVGLLLIDWETTKRHRPAEWIAAFVALLSLFALAGYAYRQPWFYVLERHTAMAVHSALGLFLLSIGLFIVRPDVGFMKVVSGDSPGGLLARRLFPLMVAGFLLLGVLRIAGERQELYDTQFGVALHSLVAITIFGALICSSASSLHKMDAERKFVEVEREKFFSLSLDLMAIADTKGYFIKVNPSFSRVLGYDSAELITRPYLEFIHPDDVARTNKELSKLDSGKPTIQFENRYRHKNGVWKWLSWTAQPPTEGVMYAVARDVTEQKESQSAILHLNGELLQQTARLEAVNQELESFSYSVSHDLRAPLRGIAGFAQALEEHPSAYLDETCKGYLMRISKAADRMGELIDDLLKLSRLSRAEMKLQSVNLSEMAEKVVAELRKINSEREVEVIIQPVIPVLGDPALLRVMLENLIDNAWKFTSKNPSARIEIGATAGAGPAGGGFVRDNGVGFDARYAHKLFGAFQRLHSQAEFPGTGIGLATVLRVVRRHGGEVEAKGAINGGATFTFKLGNLTNHGT